MEISSIKKRLFLEFISNDKIYLREKYITQYEIESSINTEKMLISSNYNQDEINNRIEEKIKELKNNEYYKSLCTIYSQSSWIVKKCIDFNTPYLLFLFSKKQKDSLLKLKFDLEKIEKEIIALESLKNKELEIIKLKKEIDVKDIRNDKYLCLRIFEFKTFDYTINIKEIDLIPISIKEGKDKFEITYALNEHRGSEYTDLIKENDVKENGDVIGSNKKIFKKMDELKDFLKKWKIELDKKYDMVLKSLE